MNRCSRLTVIAVLWHEHVREKPGFFVRHWPGKQDPSFADMLVTLRRDCLRETQEKIFCAAKLPVHIQKIIRPIQRLLDLAASSAKVELRFCLDFAFVRNVYSLSKPVFPGTPGARPSVTDDGRSRR